MRRRWLALWLTFSAACGGEAVPPEPPAKVYTSCRLARAPTSSCSSATAIWADLLPYGESDPERAALDEAAQRFDRLFHVVNAVTTGVNTEATVSSATGRDAVAAFAAAGGWDFSAVTGVTVEEVVDGWSKVAGAYAGVGVAADAYRYGTLRDQGADCAELERAQAQLERDLDALHLATAITGGGGIIARGFARKDVAGIGQSVETVPLFDASGQPLPPEKTNGSWREDNSEGGLYPDYVWEDSCSRDQLAGWVTGMAAAWEVIADDPAFDDQQRARLQQDAAAIARSLMVVRDRGYDLEIWDADDRPTQHAILNENGIDTGYLPGAANGFNALLALGIISALAYVAEESDIYAYLYEQLLAERRLHLLALENLVFLDLGEGSNYSSYNMAFLGGWLGQRYLCDEEARAVVAQATAESVYDRGGDRQPREQKQTLYDFVYAVSDAGATAFGPMQREPDAMAVAHGVESLEQFAAAPFFDDEVINCDPDEIAAGACQAVDGTPLTLLGEVGWNDELVAAEPLPMGIRPPSNYYWRSNPYRVNGGGDGSGLYPAVDFRFTYWMARWVRRP